MPLNSQKEDTQRLKEWIERQKSGDDSDPHYDPRPDIETVLERVGHFDEIMEAVNTDSLASDGWEMIEAAMREGDSE